MLPTIVGPFREMITMNHLASGGPLADRNLEIISYGAVIIEKGMITGVGKFDDILKAKANDDYVITEMEEDLVMLPGFIDCHTHLCFAGSRAGDFARRIAGKSYLEIAREGGGIWQTVEATKNASTLTLEECLKDRVRTKIQQGVTTLEIKSGYGLEVASEIRQLEVIRSVGLTVDIDLIPTCLAAHIRPPDFPGQNNDYLQLMLKDLLPACKSGKLCNRIDIFIEAGAFSVSEGRSYLQKARELGFDLTIHADQFNASGSYLAAEAGAVSADHLESSGEEEIKSLVTAGVVCTVLPGASLGLGTAFAPARKILNLGGCLAIASDQNPGSAPHGDLLTQAAILAAFEKINTAETFAGITFRAAKALGLKDRGRIDTGLRADLVAFRTDDYREILYQQGNLRPCKVWSFGKEIPVL